MPSAITIAGVGKQTSGGYVRSVIGHNALLPPISLPKARRKLAREIPHRAQMVFKTVDRKRPVFVPSHMGKIVCHSRVSSEG